MKNSFWQAILCSFLAMSLSVPISAAPKTPLSIKMKWLTYTDQGGFYKVSFPSSWQVLTKGNEVVITRFDGEGGDRGIFGIIPRPEGVTIQESINKEFSDPNRPANLTKSPARVANQPATKVAGSKKGDPSTRIVEYYVQKGTQQYYILLQAPQNKWSKYSPFFDRMVASLKFPK